MKPHEPYNPKAVFFALVSLTMALELYLESIPPPERPVGLLDLLWRLECLADTVAEAVVWTIEIE